MLPHRWQPSVGRPKSQMQVLVSQVSECQRRVDWVSYEEGSLENSRLGRREAERNREGEFVKYQPSFVPFEHHVWHWLPQPFSSVPLPEG